MPLHRTLCRSCHPEPSENLIAPFFKLYLITDRKLAAGRGGLLAMTAAALSAAPPGTVALQLREKDLDARELIELTRQLRVICDRHSARLLVNDRIDIAIAARADGVHLPTKSFAVADARVLFGPRGLIGVSTHRDTEVIAASEAGADFVVYGPVFDPLSKDAYTSARGADGLIAACNAASVPVFALGGIDAQRVRDLRAEIATANAKSNLAAGPASAQSRAATQLAGVAVIGAIYGVPDPAAAMGALLDALTR